MTRLNPKRLVALSALVFAVGCTEELQHDLTEQDANDILVVLRENGIKARKIREEGGQEPTYLIKTASQDSAHAVKLLREYALPREKAEGLGTFRKAGRMIPTAMEERAMYHEALGGEVSMALQKIDGVLEARTIINIPEINDLTQPDKKPLPTASILVRYRPTLEGRPPADENVIKRFIATAVPEMRPDNVTVILSQAQPPSADANPDARLQDVLGFAMPAASARDFKIIVAVVALIVLALAAFTIWNLLRGGAQQGGRA